MRQNGGNDNKGLPAMIARRGGALALIGSDLRFRRRLRGKSTAYARGCRRVRQSGPVGRQVGLRRLPQGRGSGAHDERGGGAVQPALRHRQGPDRRSDDESRRPEGIVGAGPQAADRPARPIWGRQAPRAAPTIASSPMSMRTRSRRFGSIQTMRVAMARQFTCGAESANQRFIPGLDLQSTEHT